MSPTTRGIQTRTRADGGTSYLVRIRRAGFRETATFDTIEDAQAWRARAVKAAKGQGDAPTKPARVPVPTGPATTVADAARRLCKGMRDGTIRNHSGRLFKPSVVRGYESDLRLHVLPQIGGLPVSALTHGDVQRLADDLAAERSASVARKTVTALRVVLRVADRYGELRGENPCSRVRVPAGEQEERCARVLDLDEQDRLRQAAQADDQKRKTSITGPLVTLGLDTGLRLGEILALEWGRNGLDIDAGIVHVRFSLDTHRDDEGHYPRVAPKYRASVRDVPLPASAIAVLKRHRLATGRPADGVLVFRNEAGGPVPHQGYPRYAWDRVLVAAKITEPLPRFHDLRHTFATDALGAGLGAHAVAELLGHADAALVLARYGHPLPGEVHSAANIIEAARLARAQNGTEMEHGGAGGVKTS